MLSFSVVKCCVSVGSALEAVYGTKENISNCFPFSPFSDVFFFSEKRMAFSIMRIFSFQPYLLVLTLLT